ncbi:MAG: methylated-DNA--[protein]-cysteine S-methyltransferase [Paramuribaculum sp.]|nr:methylated-DNA--[protein]-cysteine S-methyltransferase [Paramuribaculum sp.]
MRASTPDPVIRCTTPVGTLILGAAAGALTLCDWEDSRHIEKHIAAAQISDNCAGLLEQAKIQVEEYFAGERNAFTLPLTPAGTPFQKQIWTALSQTGYGETLSYAQIASRIGRPEAVRAVANAIGANPISILIPCHRVIGSDGSLTGYAGGIAAKQFLLDLESSCK